MRGLSQFLPRELKERETAPSDVCPRCGASPNALTPLVLMCAICRDSIGNQSWRAPIQLRQRG